MNRINKLRGEIDEIRKNRKRMITEHIVRVFNANKRPAYTMKSLDVLSHESENRLQDIGSELEGLKSDIEKYRKNISGSKLFFRDFKVLTEHVLCR